MKQKCKKLKELIDDERKRKCGLKLINVKIFSCAMGVVVVLTPPPYLWAL